MIATEAAFTPSRKAENSLLRRMRGISGCDNATNTKEGRKIASVAKAADCHPPICQPIKVTDENTGPGVNCPTAMASINTFRDNNPFATSSLSRNANNTCLAPYRIAPILRRLVSRHEYDSLGEEFEDNEHKHFGADGFEIMVGKVADIEKQLGIYDLNQFTPG